MRFDPQASFAEDDGEGQPVVQFSSPILSAAPRVRSPLRTAVGILGCCLVAGIGLWLWGEFDAAAARRDAAPVEVNPETAAVIRYAEAMSSGQAEVFATGEGVLSEGEFDRLAADLSVRHRLSTVREEFEVGRELQAMGRHAEALPHLVEAVKLDPQFAEAHYRLGLAYVHTGDMRKAAKEVETLAKLDADQAALLESLIPH